MTMLKGMSLTRSYSSLRPVLDRVDVEIAPSSVTALLGANGCGKSTLLRTLSMLEPPDSGTVDVDGVVYGHGRATPDSSPWPSVTLVFQQLFLWPHLTVRKNIMLPQSQN